jgi:sulfur-oxidizing protein SoxX
MVTAPSGFLAALLLCAGLHVAAEDQVPFTVVDNAIPAALTASPGNPARGSRIVRDTGNVTCLICHQLPFPDEPDQGAIGPDLAGVGSRLTPAELRLRLVNPKLLDPDTLMPAYYETRGLYRVDRAHVGTTIYSAQDIEDVVAWLSSLTEPGQ